MNESTGGCTGPGVVAGAKRSCYQFSSTHVPVPPNLANEIVELGENEIDDDDIYADPDGLLGRSRDPHVTVLYGLHTERSDAVRIVLGDTYTFPIRLGKISRFTDSPKFDVLKIEAESLEIKKLHERLKRLPNSHCFPTYKPHVTLAFVRKGTCRRLNGSKAFCNLAFTAREIVFSSRLGYSEVIPLG